MGSIECILQLNCVSIYMLPLLIQKHAKYTPGRPLKKCCFEDYFLSAFWELFREKTWNFGCWISQLNPSCWKSRGTFSFLQSSSMGAKYNRHLAVRHRDVQAPYVRLQKSIERQIFFYRCKLALKKNIAGFGITDLEPSWCFYRNDYPPFLVTITHHNLHLEVGIPIPPPEKIESLSPEKKWCLEDTTYVLLYANYPIPNDIWFIFWGGTTGTFTFSHSKPEKKSPRWKHQTTRLQIAVPDRQDRW